MTPPVSVMEHKILPAAPARVVSLADRIAFDTESMASAARRIGAFGTRGSVLLELSPMSSRARAARWAAPFFIQYDS